MRAACDLDAGGIASELPGGRSGGGNAAPGSPEPDSERLRGHQSALSLQLYEVTEELRGKEPGFNRSCATAWPTSCARGPVMENRSRPESSAKSGLTRLEKLLYRLEAQHAVLAWAFEQIAGRDGIVFELGLGKGRTFDHLRHHLPERQIWVFERDVDAIPDCRPDPAYLIEGDMASTLPVAARRFKGQVVLAHSDVGSFDHERNIAMAKLVSAELPLALAPSALVLSDLPLELRGARQLMLPSGARHDRYFIYRQDARSIRE